MTNRRLPSTTLALALCALATSADTGWAKYIKKNILDKVEVSGYRQLGYHVHKVEGDRSAFNSLNYFGQGDKRFTNIGQIELTGRNVLGVLNFKASIQDDRYQDPQGQRFSIDYLKKGVQVNLGDLQSSLLNNNRFASLNKSLKGVAVGYSTKRFSGRIVTSEAKGSARTVNIDGNNSSGPYYLQASQIVPGSERIRLDDLDLRPGEDYVINYEVGSITLIGRIVALTSSIVASYEAFGYNERRGIVQGVGVNYDAGKAGRLSLTALQQRARGSGVASSRLEKFQGFGPPSTPYTLQFEPLQTAPITVKVDGILQALGVDYTFDPDNSAIFYFTRFIPATSDVDVVYTPVPRSTANGDRENLGLEYRLGVRGKNSEGAVIVTNTLGRLTNSALNSSGIAKAIALGLRGQKYDLNASIRDVPNGFTAVESVGFNRNEKAQDLYLNFRPDSKWNISLGQSNSAVGIKQSTGAFTTNRATKVESTARYEVSTNRSYKIEQSFTRSKSLFGESSVNRSAIDQTARAGKWDWTAGLERQTGDRTVGSGATKKQEGFSLNGLKGTTSYVANSQLSLRGSASLLKVKTGTTGGTGRDYDFSAAYRPKDKLTFTTRYAVSDGGALATLGSFSNGYGSGYDGNGFSGGSTSGFGAGATNVRSWVNVVTWVPSDRFSMSANYFLNRSSGSVSSNSDTRSTGLNARYAGKGGYDYSVAIDQSQTKFIGSTQTSSSTSLTGYFDARPQGRLSYQLGGSTFISGGSSTFKQNSSSINFSANYRLADRHSLLLDLRSGKSSGYLPQDDLTSGLTYQYRIWQNLSLNASYTFRRTNNLDPNVNTGAYRSHSLDFSLGFNFGRF
ncbi:MAG: hypothetical protein K8R88_04370 [Armatimonadetes bacterium]|nr:hypothetical protein [Armatimonadota bacterium]